MHDVLNAQGFAMHYRAISNAEAISKFSDVREECPSLYSKEKGWIDSVHVLFNLYPKIKKVLNNMAIQLVIEESPVCVGVLLDLFKQIVPFICKVVFLCG